MGYQYFSKVEEEFIRNNTHLQNTVIADVLGRTYWSVVHFRKRNGITRTYGSEHGRAVCIGDGRYVTSNTFNRTVDRFGFKAGYRSLQRTN